MRRLPVRNPSSRWERLRLTYDEGEAPEIDLEIIEDKSRSILSKNDSPDVGFDYSVNPYRGCFHGCAYCYARPTHEYLGLGAGSDFERRIVVKLDAPALLKKALSSPEWKRELIVFSGVTDCYQPLEGKLALMRGCLQACLEARNPVGIITKSALVERDIELLQELHRVASVRVSVSIPFLDEDHARAMEPYVTTASRRLRTIERLAAAGIPVGVSVSPIIPGLNDDSIVRVLNAAKSAGATYAFYVLLRLPGSAADVFVERLRERLPLRAEKVLARLRDAHGGALRDSRFGTRQRGHGAYAQTIDQLFSAAKKRLGLSSEPYEVPRAHESRESPQEKPPGGRQLELF